MAMQWWWYSCSSLSLPVLFNPGLAGPHQRAQHVPLRAHTPLPLPGPWSLPESLNSYVVLRYYHHHLQVTGLKGRRREQEPIVLLAAVLIAMESAKVTTCKAIQPADRLI